MLNEQLSDVYLKLMVIKATKEEQPTDLILLINHAKEQKNKRYDLPDFFKLVANAYDRKPRSLNLQLEQTYKYTFSKLMDIVNFVESYEIDTWLKIRGMRVGVFESKLSISKKAVYDIRKGYYRPKYDTWVEICNALDISLYELKLPPKIDYPKK